MSAHKWRGLNERVQVVGCGERNGAEYLQGTPREFRQCKVFGVLVNKGVPNYAYMTQVG
jgi:hypothetical protein